VRRRSAVVALVSCLIAGALGACGVPNDGEPRGIASDDVPDGLLASPTTVTVVPDATAPTLIPTTLPVSTEPVTVYLVIAAQDRVLPVERNGPPPATSVVGAAQAAADVLVQSPLSLERLTGLTTTLTSTTIRCLRVEDGTLDIEVSELPRVIADQPLAMAQIVLTLTLVDGVRRIRVFRESGEFSRVPLWVGGETEPGVPVDRSDYFTAIGSIAPTEATTTTAPTTAPAPVTTAAVPVETTAPPTSEQTPPTEPAPPAEGGTG
jgi:hypothetical protein